MKKLRDGLATLFGMFIIAGIAGAVTQIIGWGILPGVLLIVGIFLLYLVVTFIDKRNIRKSGVDSMEGHDFEHYVADILKRSGFTNVKVTPGSGDYGADILASKKGKTYVIQCKRYSGKVPLSAVQEAHFAKGYYHTDYAVVVTNSDFTPAAVKGAKESGVELWDRSSLERLISQAR